LIDAPERIAHHDLCFGCGLANPFGLQLELAAGPEGEVRGRFFVKQDHQGPGGAAHGGVLASALADAMSLAVSPEGTATPTRLELELRAPAPVGTYVQVSARAEGPGAGGRRAAAELRGAGGEPIAEGRAVFDEPGAAG
jgi:acyl-coenzyme A thioesterase PaaI-like protein